MSKNDKRKKDPQRLGDIYTGNSPEMFHQPIDTSEYKSIIHQAAQPPRGYKRKKEFKMPDIPIARFKMQFRSTNGKKKIVPSLEREREKYNKGTIDEMAGLIRLIRLATGLEPNKWGRYLSAAYIYMSLEPVPAIANHKHTVKVLSMYPDNIIHDFEQKYGDLPFTGSLVDLQKVKQLISNQ